MDDIISDILEDIGDNELKHYGVKGMKWDCHCLNTPRNMNQV